MNVQHLIAVTICLAGAGWGAVHAAPAQAPAGRWLTESGNLEVEVAACGQALCGTVVKVVSNRSMGAPAMASAGAPTAPAAVAAPDARPLLGLAVLQNLTPGADGQWQGRIYNRERDASYDCQIGLAGPDLLQVSITVAPALPPRVQFWHRVGAAEK